MAIVNTPDFIEYKKALAEFIKSKPGFEDYNFDAEALNILTDILAYNTQQNAWNVNMAFSEMFLDTAQLRESVVSLAQLIGYTPQSITSAKATVRLTCTGTPNGTVVIPKDFQFNAKGKNNQNLRFVSRDTHTVVLNPAGVGIVDVVLLEGTRKIYKFEVKDNKNKFIIPIPNMDLSSLIVKVYPTKTAITFSQWYRFDNLINLTKDTEVFWIHESLNNSYQIQFGDDFLGKKPSNLNVVSVEYLLSSGEQGNYANNFTVATNLPGTTIAVATITPGVGGRPKESIDTIKARAPLNYATQDRVVTKSDYEILIRHYFEDIQAISVWGGEEHSIPAFGKVFVSIKPNFRPRLSKIEIYDILTYIKTKQIVTNSLEYIHADILDVVLYTNVKLKNNNISKGGVEAAIKAAILNFASKEINTFNSSLKYSRVASVIDTATETVDYNTLSVELIYKLFPLFNNKQLYNLSFDNAIIPGSVSASNIIIQTKAAVLKDDGAGKIFIYRPVNNNLLKLAEVGTVNYETGQIVLSQFAPEYDGADFISINAVPQNYDISAKNEKILELSANNIYVDFI